MAFHDDRAACGKGGCGVTARSRESERKVGCSENGNRANRTLNQPDFRAWRWLSVRQGLVNAAIQIVTLPDRGGTKAELAGGASTLAFKSARRQAGFLRADFGDGGSARFDFVGDSLKELSAFFTACISISPESIFRRFAGARHKSGRANCKFMRWARCRCRGKCRLPCHPFTGDQMASVGLEIHGHFHF